MPTNVSELLVPVTKSAAMRYIAETVGYGYYLHQSGAIPASKVLGVIEKMESKYRVLASRGTRDNDRLRGRSCSRLVVFPQTEELGGLWLYWLLGTEGEGVFTTENGVLDARQPGQRLRWEDQYELVARPVCRRGSGQVHYVWTWVFTEHMRGRWDRAFKRAAGRVRSSQEKKPSYLISLVENLRKVPGFHGLNKQKLAILKTADIPKAYHDELDLGRLGTVVNKALPVFDPKRTVGTLLAEATILTSTYKS